MAPSLAAAHARDDTSLAPHEGSAPGTAASAPPMNLRVNP